MQTMTYTQGGEEEYIRLLNGDGRECEPLFTLATKWALLMEQEIAQGKTVAECADECFSKTTGDISAHWFAHVVLILAVSWIHGAELQIWHNERWGVNAQQGAGKVALPHIGDWS